MLIVKHGLILAQSIQEAQPVKLKLVPMLMHYQYLDLQILIVMPILMDVHPILEVPPVKSRLVLMLLLVLQPKIQLPVRVGLVVVQEILLIV